MDLPPIFQAAWFGDVAEMTRLNEADPSLLNARDDGTQETPLMLAALHGHEAVVEKLLALGADVGLRDNFGNTAVHGACIHGRPSILALLLDAGASVSLRDNDGWTPLMSAALHHSTECVRLLVGRSSDEAVNVDAQDKYGRTALFVAAAVENCIEALRLLLDAGADPTIPDNDGETPLSRVQYFEAADAISLLEAALAEPEPARLLLKARALLDAAVAVPKAFESVRQKSLPMLALQRAALAAAPAYLKGRVAWAQELPRVEVVNNAGPDEQLVACVEYALGLKYGGAVRFEGQEPPPPGMVKEVFVELCEMLVPKWARAEM